MADSGSIRTLSPWALRPTIRAEVLEPANDKELASLVGPRHGGTLPMGALRSYGDACINEGGLHLSTHALASIRSFDADTGVLVCDAGVTLRTVLDRVAMLGWFLSVVPGTMLSSVGGAVACDVHGKSHHRHGSFSSNVLHFDIVTADGQIRRCSREENAALFWATIGGLGQTGVVTCIALQLIRIGSSYISLQHVRTRDLDETLDACFSLEDDFSVCWIDSLARGRHLGRGVLMIGHHASAEEVKELKPRAQPFERVPERPLSLPIFVPELLSGTATWRAFNSAYYALQGRHPRNRLLHYAPYFFPLDGVAHWNRVYGRRGFLEYQFAVPLESAATVCREVLERLTATGNGSFLAVLKRLGAPSGGHLSFPIEGITLAVDMPARGTEQAALLNLLDGVVARAGGRIYMVKDSRMDASFVPVMYPRLAEWNDVVNLHDPNGIFTSSLVRRLALRR